MGIGPREVERIAKLARLSISSQEKKMFGSQLGKTLDYIEKLNELDTSKVEPTSHVIELINVTREDILKQSIPVDDVLKNAPDRSDNFYRVPKIIE
jgi:aspartyl-tRNA(Asn)/glutamyl-tRNA(Gln) amidotransferase subunit C